MSMDASPTASWLSDDDLTKLAKADLHVHLVGSAAPVTVAELAGRHPDTGVPADEGALGEYFEFQDFGHFLEVYGAVSALVRLPEDIVALVVGLADVMAAQGTAYAEVTVTPTAHVDAGIGLDDLAQALDIGARRARSERGVELAWVYDINGLEGATGAARTLEAALRHPPAALVGFGLGGPEVGAPRAAYADYFAAARAAGLHSVPHAGESVGPEEVWAAIERLGAERVGHGIAAVSDLQLLDRLRDEGIILEVCPSSNVATGVVASLAEHPLPALVAAGVGVALGSDDPPMFNTSLLDEYRRVRDEMLFDASQLRTLARTSIAASFAPEAVKRDLLSCRSSGAPDMPESAGRL